MFSISNESMSRAFGLNVRVIHMQLAGLTHEDALRQPAARGNCANWVLGHLINTRDRLLPLLDEKPVFGESEQTLYSSDTAPITADSTGMPQLATLLAALDEQQARLVAGLGRATASALQMEIERDGRRQPVGDFIFGIYFHDTYHVGQFEYLRQLTGVNDKVI